MLLLSLLVFGQVPTTPSDETYQTPPKLILEGATSAYYKNITPGAISPDGTRFLHLERDGMPPLAALAKPHYNLGGLQIDFAANRIRNLTTRSDAGLRVFEISTKKWTVVDLPKGSRVSDAQWSPDSKWIAFLCHFADGTKLYVADPFTGKSHAATGRSLLPTLDTNFSWTADARLVAIFVPDHRPAPPVKPDVATTPHLQISDEKGAKLETFPSVLKTPYDAALLEYYTTGELGIADPVKQSLTEVGKPAMYRSVNASPHAKFFMASVMQKPFSYLVPTASFGERQVILDSSGKELVELDKRATRTGAPAEDTPAKPNAKRQIEWLPGKDELAFLRSVTPAAEDEEEGTPARPHDQIAAWKAPFSDKDTTAIYDASGTVSSYSFGPAGKGFFLVEGSGTGARRGGGGRGTRGAAAPAAGEQPRKFVSVADAKATPVTLATIQANAEESPTLARAADGTILESADGKSAYLTGEHTYADPYSQAPRPFIDRVSLTDGKKSRLFFSSAEEFETATLLGTEGTSMLVTRQSPSKVPQTFLVTESDKAGQALTDNRDYLPDVSQARRQYLTMTRADGFKFKVKVTLPSFANHAPAFFWIYPAEFENQEAYDRSKRTFNKNLFVAATGSNKDILTRLGYVVVEPDVPITGPRGRMNDEYVLNLRNGLSAAIDELEARGWIDRKRLAVGGHSYGAFSTANALAHTPFFKCGIAGDGNYLRPLTPFGFQNEGRQLWEARGTYLDMSPLLYAEDFTGALLMYHGQEDQNVGTDPINSDRLFTALEELGKPAELVTYPYEDHGQIARESILDQWSRFSAWLEKWLK